MVLTRSMIKATLNTDTLTTPGIATQIVSHLDQNDEAITSLFMLVNNANLRYELQPFVDKFADLKKAEYIENKKKEQEKKREMIKTHLLDSINNVMFIHGRRKRQKKAKMIMDIFEYMCSLGDDMYLVGTYKLVYDIKASLCKCIRQAIRFEMKEFEIKLKEFRVKLLPFIDFYLEHGDISYITIGN